MNKKRMAIMLGASAVIFGGVFGFVAFRNHMIAQFFANQPVPVIAVTASAARAEQWQGAVQAVGTLRAVNGVEISSEAAGIVREIAFQSGQQVGKGQVLLRLDADVELGDLRSARAEAQLARTNFERSRKLAADGHLSKAALDRDQAELNVKEARAASLQAAIDRKVVVAPFDGTLGVRRVDLGQYVQPGQSIVALQDLSALMADFTVSQKDLGAVAPGQPVRLTTDAWPGRVFEGVVTAVDSKVDQASGMLAVEARFPNPDSALRPGLFARVEVVRPAERAVVTVPVSAVTYNLHGDSVFVVKEAEGAKTADRAFVQLGERRDGRVAVLSGLEPGALVVTSGQVKLDQGSKVDVRKEDPLSVVPASAQAAQ